MAKKSLIVSATTEYARKHFFSSARVKVIEEIYWR